MKRILAATLLAATLLAATFGLIVGSTTINADAWDLNAPTFVSSNANVVSRIYLHAKYCLSDVNDVQFSPDLSSGELKYMNQMAVAYTKLTKDNPPATSFEIHAAYDRLIIQIQSANFKSIGDVCRFLINGGNTDVASGQVTKPTSSLADTTNSMNWPALADRMTDNSNLNAKPAPASLH